MIVLLLLKVKSCSYNRGLTYGAKLSDLKNEQTIKQYKDANGKIHSQIALLEGNLKEITIAYEKTLKTKAAELNVKPKHIKAITTVTQERQLNIDSLIRKYARIDTLRITKDTTLYITRTDHLIIPIKDSIAITEYRKRVHLFKRSSFIDVLNYTPGTVIKSIDGFRLKSYSSNLNIGPTFSYTWTGNSFKLMVGVGVQFKLFGFRVGKR